MLFAVGACCSLCLGSYIPVPMQEIDLFNNSVKKKVKKKGLLSVGLVPGQHCDCGKAKGDWMCIKQSTFKSI